MVVDLRSKRSCPILDLPGEVFQAILDLLPSAETENDLLNLSSTNKSFRDFLAPQILNTVTLRNREGSGSSLKAIAEGNHGQCVRHIYYLGIVPDGFEAPGWNDEIPAPIPFPPSVHSVLSNLDRFQNLQSVAYEFPVREGWRAFLDLHEIPDTGETALETQQQEQTNGWRCLMAQSLHALAENREINFQQFDLRQFPLIPISTFDTDAWHAFLGRLKGFTLSLRGWDGAGWRLNTFECWMVFTQQMDHWFFNHLSSIRHFVFEASEYGAMGGESSGDDGPRAPLALRTDQMPLLQSINLRYLFICPELRDFLISHMGTLEEIEMWDCISSMYEVEGVFGNDRLADYIVPMDWSRFCNAISEVTPRSLRKFKANWTSEILWDEPEFDRLEESRIERSKVHDRLDDDPEAFLFLYGCVDEKYGMIFDDMEVTRKRFIDGDDQVAYWKLLEIVEENASRSGSAASGSKIPGQVLEHRWDEKPTRRW